MTDQNTLDEIEGYWHKAKCDKADSDYSIICDCHLEIRKIIAQETKKAKVRGINLEEQVIRDDERLKSVLEIVELFPTHSKERKVIAEWWANKFSSELKAQGESK